MIFEWRGSSSGRGFYEQSRCKPSARMGLPHAGTFLAVFLLPSDRLTTPTFDTQLNRQFVKTGSSSFAPVGSRYHPVAIRHPEVGYRDCCLPARSDCSTRFHPVERLKSAKCPRTG